MQLVTPGHSLRNVAKQFAVSYTALFRHKADHLPAALTKAQEAAEVAHADNLLEQVKDLQRRTLAILSQAEQTAQLKTALQAIGQARSNLELLARLVGELQEAGTVNIVLCPEWVEIRTVILQTLQRHPEARASVTAALEGKGC